ncbi:MAG: hypothetical protein WCT33_03810 [Patescibacteria group bacterium]|jgi:hypothetical protein
MSKILEFAIQIGIGSIIGVIIGMLFQYFVSKKLKIFETKLIIFRRLYKQLYFIILFNREEIDNLQDGLGINAAETISKSGLDLKKDLGDSLYYVDGKLETMIVNLISCLYDENGIMGKSDINNMEEIMTKLKKLI